MESAGIASVTTTTDAGQSLTVQSNHSTQAELEKIHKPADEKKEPKTVSEAASELGRKGGEAAAKARAAVKRAEAKQAKESESEGAEVEAKGDEDAEPAHPKRARDAGKADEGADAPDSDEDSERDREKPLGKPRDDPRARVAQVTRQHAETKRALEAERQQRADLERRLSEIERQSRPAAKPSQEAEQVDDGEPPAPDEPKPEDYETFDKWLKATLDHRDQVREVKRQVASQHYRQSAYIHTEKAGLRDAIIKGFGDADTVHATVSEEVLALKPSLFLADGEQRDGRNFIADEIMADKEKAKDYLLFFTENPDEFQRVASLRTPREVTRAMAKLPIDAENAGASAKGPQVSKAKPPIEPVSGGPRVADGEAYKGEGQSLEDYAAAWNRKIKPKLRR